MLQIEEVARMRTKDNSLMQKIANCFNSYYRKEGVKPSTRIVAKELSINPSTVSRYLREMACREMLIYEDGNVETIITTKTGSNSLSVPLLGSISCGEPLLEEENIEAYFRLPEQIFGKGDFFLLRANGDSMINAGIDNGDLVLIRQCKEANKGDIVVALTDSNENTLKRFFPEKSKKRVVLKAENPKYPDIITKQCQIQGVAVKVIKDLK